MSEPERDANEMMPSHIAGTLGIVPELWQLPIGRLAGSTTFRRSDQCANNRLPCVNGEMRTDNRHHVLGCLAKPAFPMRERRKHRDPISAKGTRPSESFC
jgi:hypothetical protein